jgi:hypothetical protein
MGIGVKRNGNYSQGQGFTIKGMGGGLKARPVGEQLGLVTLGLVMHLDSADVASYPGSGTAWYDLSGNGADATLYNTPTFENPPGNLRFDRASYEYAATATALSSLTNWTVEAWVNLDVALEPGINAIVTDTFNGGNINFAIGSLEPGNTLLRAGFFNGSWRNTSGFTAATGVWYDVVGTYDGSDVKLYVNDVVEGTLNYSGTSASGGTDVRIARRWDSSPTSSGNYIDGAIPIVRIYNRALSAAEVSQNFSFQRGRFGV